MLIKLEYLFSGEVAKPLSQTVLILKPRVVSAGVFHRVGFLTVVNKNIAVKCMLSARLFRCLPV